MTTSRRDLFKFAGGSALGILFTPAPWRLISDTALWSENWPGIPRPARGEIRTKLTHCSLCTAGCAVRARCVGDQPVALAGVAGGLCPFGITGHHLPYHPARLKEGPVAETAAAVADALARRAPGENVAVLDLRPGRTASWTHRRSMAAVKNGLYLAPPQPPVAVDLAKAKTILSLGAPLFETWGTPAKVFAARDGFRLIQAEPVESPTAALADLWLPIRPGSEEALALGLANEITLAETARQTGLSEPQIASLAHELAANGPALVLDRSMSPAVIRLNRQLGAWGRTLGPRPEAPVPPEWKNAAPVTGLAAVPDRSIGVLLIDESAPGGYLPWQEIEKKLVADNPLVVVFGWSRNGYGRYTRHVLPTAVYPEAMDDIPPAIDSMAPTFRLSIPLLPPPAGVVNPAEFVAGIAGIKLGDPLRERAHAIQESEDFWKSLLAGAAWVGQAPPCGAGCQPGVESSTLAPPAAVLSTATPNLTLISPLLSKLYQESNLQLAPNCIALHPKDARAIGVENGAPAFLDTPNGKWRVEIWTDTSVRPGVILAARPEMAGAPGKVVRV